jgi:hypothetical protein
MTVSPFKAAFDPLTLQERLAAAYEAIDKINSLGQANGLRANTLERAKLPALMQQVDWLEAKISALNPSGAYNLVRLRGASSHRQRDSSHCR